MFTKKLYLLSSTKVAEYLKILNPEPCVEALMRMIAMCVVTVKVLPESSAGGCKGFAL